MNKPDVKKLILLNLPYVFAFYFADKIAAVFRLAPGTEFIDKLTNGFAVFGTTFANPLPSFHPVDLLIGVIAGALLKLAVYVKGKNRKKFRHSPSENVLFHVGFIPPEIEFWYEKSVVFLRRFGLSKNYPTALVSAIIEETGVFFMEDWRKDARREPIIVDLDALVPKDHLLRKIEKIMDYEWLYERLEPYYCHDNGRPGTDPVVLIKMVLLQHLFGIPSLRQTYREIQVNNAYRWFLGYGLLDEIPHFATVSYAFCKRFPDELASEIFEHILNKALNNRMLDPSTIFIDGTHIKASANKKKFRKEQVAKAAKVYSGQLRKEVNEEREKLGKKPIEDEDDENHPKGG